MFGVSFSRFCGNTLACPVCVGFFQANMPKETNHSSEIAAIEYRANSLPADENTPLVREANSTSRQHRLCEHFNYRHFLLGFFLKFLSAEGVLLVTNIIFFLKENLEESPISTKGYIPYITLYVFVVVFSCESL